MKKKKANIIVYQNKSGAIEFKGDFKKETIWATQAQIALAFNANARTINEHITNIYKSGELKKTPTIRKFRIVQKEGKRSIEREIQHYNLDLIISVGYRVNSKKDTEFRKWATKVLHAHIVEGYTINKKRLTTNYRGFLKIVEDIKKFLPASGEVKANDVLELVKIFANNWLSLGAYDKSKLPKIGFTKKGSKIMTEELSIALADLKRELINKKEATDLFGMEKDSYALSGIIGNVFQSIGGRGVYPTIEEKAAHLLYFIIKNHPFVDGNKRSGAFAFV